MKNLLFSKREIRFLMIFSLLIILIYTFLSSLQLISSPAKAQNSNGNSVTPSICSPRAYDDEIDAWTDILQGPTTGIALNHTCARTQNQQFLGGQNPNEPGDSPNAPDTQGNIIQNFSPERTLADTQSYGTVLFEGPPKYVDSGLFGLASNTYVNFYGNEISDPSYQVQYYALKAQNKAYAADLLTGSETLRPVYYLFLLFRNIAYAVIIIVLITSGMSLLINTLAGGEQNKLTIFSLLLNTGIALILITFWYELAAIIYDLTVNWGNAIVASIAEPFINAKLVLQRLQPGGDLNIVALLNVYQFQGFSQTVLTVANNVLFTAYPLVDRTTSLVTEIIPEVQVGGAPGDVLNVGQDFIVNIFRLGIGLFMQGVSVGLYSFTNSKSILDLIVSWTLFFINIRIFLSLLIAFIFLNAYTAFGSIFMLNAVNGGIDKIMNSFKLLIGFGLVFPFTLLFLLLGASTFHFTTPNATSDGSGSPRTSYVTSSYLCGYSLVEPPYVTEYQEQNAPSEQENSQELTNDERERKQGEVAELEIRIGEFLEKYKIGEFPPNGSTYYQPTEQTAQQRNSVFYKEIIYTDSPNYQQLNQELFDELIEIIGFERNYENGALGIFVSGYFDETEKVEVERLINEVQSTDPADIDKKKQLYEDLQTELYGIGDVFKLLTQPRAISRINPYLIIDETENDTVRALELSEVNDILGGFAREIDIIEDDLNSQEPETNAYEAFRGTSFIDLEAEIANQDVFNSVARIYKTEEVKMADGSTVNRQVMDCRSKLFPYPFTYLPAPLGSFGNRGVQIQTTDALIRMLIGIYFLFLAIRVKKIVFAIGKIDELDSLKGIERVAISGIAPTLLLAAQGLSALSFATPVVNRGAGIVRNTIGGGAVSPNAIGKTAMSVANGLSNTAAQLGNLSKTIGGLSNLFAEAILDES